MSTEKKSFLKHAATYGIGTLLLQSLSVVLLPLYTHYLEPSEMGVLEILNNIGNVFTILLMANGIRMAALTLYCQAKDEEQRKRTAATLTITLLGILAVCGLACVPLAGPISTLMGLGNPRLFLFAMATILLQATTSIPYALMLARIESGAYVLANTIEFCCRLTLTVLALVWLNLGVWGVLGATGITSAAMGAVLTAREFAQGSLRPDWKRMAEVLRFALPFVPGGICLFILHNGDRFFLKEFGMGAVGLYALGYRLASSVGAFTASPLMSVWNAKIHHEIDGPAAPRLVGQIFTRILAAYLLAGLGVAILQDEIVAILGSPEYAAAAATIGVIVLAYFFLYASNLMDLVFYSRRRTDLKPWIAAGSTIVTLGLYAWLIPQYAAMGAAWATLGGFAFHAFLTYLVSQRVFAVRYEWARLAAMLGVAVLLALAARAIPATPPGFFVKVGLWAAGPAILWFGGIVSREEKSLFVGLVRGTVSRVRSVPLILWGKQDA